MKLSGISIFWEYAKKLYVKSAQTRSRSTNLKPFITKLLCILKVKGEYSHMMKKNGKSINLKNLQVNTLKPDRNAQRNVFPHKRKKSVPVVSDHYTILGNRPPTPPLSQH